MSYPLHKNDTGSFQELAHASDVEFGQLSLLTIAPKCQRGGHYHTRKREWFCCIRGRCCLFSTDLRTGKHHGIVLLGEDKEFVAVEPYHFHSVVNIGDGECELLIIASEEYDEDDPDTSTFPKLMYEH